MNMKNLRLLMVALVTLSLSFPVAAGSVGEESFNANDVVETFDSLASVTPAGGAAESPIQIGLTTYSTDGGIIRVFNPIYEQGFPGDCWPEYGSCIGTHYVNESIYVDFGETTYEAGLWVGLGDDYPWTANVYFYSGDQLLGMIHLVVICLQDGNPNPKRSPSPAFKSKTSLTERLL